MVRFLPFYIYLFKILFIFFCTSIFSATTNQKNVETATPSVRKSLRNAVHQEPTEKRKTLLQADIKGKPTSVSVDTVGFKNSYFDEEESAKNLSRLWHIHCALEHLLMIQINLNLSSGKKCLLNSLLSLLILSIFL